MANKVVIFPIGKEASAAAYAAWTDNNNTTPDNGTPGSFSYIRTDAFGQSVAPYLGPPFEYPVGTPLPEPVGGVAARADGVLHDFAVYLDE